MELKHKNVKSNSAGKVLLIVPYGIETQHDSTRPLPVYLLIVPYGIETYIEKILPECVIGPFNRTLWN